jgi:hypothetical protein
MVRETASRRRAARAGKLFSLRCAEFRELEFPLRGGAEDQTRRAPAHTQEQCPAPGLGMVIAIESIKLAVRGFIRAATIASELWVSRASAALGRELSIAHQSG